MPRAQIIKRDHIKIQDLKSLMTFMRYNDYKHDEYAKCEDCKGKVESLPYAAIASRYRYSIILVILHYIMFV